ncbi:hypothetical protein LCGC14_1678940 [marine sediment metagenome]|uniref:Antitoxin n=1 Tax=marine sediment metagenome TaxID=412755 RepID=A0A0F9K4Z2_9ZZZZ
MPKQKQSTKPIRVDEKLYDYILERGTKRETFSQVIWRLIGQKKLAKEDKKQLPSEYVPKLNQGKQKR